MRVYFDSSALVKVWLDEQGSVQVEHLFMQAQMKATSLITFTECQRALFQAGLLGRITQDQALQSVADFSLHWPEFVRVRVTEALVRTAALQATKHQLRTLDALHLASALRVREQLGGLRGKPWVFAAFDGALRTAAGAEGFELL